MSQKQTYEVITHEESKPGDLYATRGHLVAFEKPDIGRVFSHDLVLRPVPPLTWRVTKTDPPKESDYQPKREFLVSDDGVGVETSREPGIWKYWLPILEIALPPEPDAFEEWWKNARSVFGFVGDKELSRKAFNAGKESAK